jgi:hypothetical protein
MKNKVIFTMFVAIMIIAACQKNDLTDSNLNVDLNKYETQLNQYYTNANQFHSVLIPVSAGSSHEAHHSTANSTTIVDKPYNMKMFSKNDSLFCDQFYQFCIDMMKNGGMMNSNTSMMGNNNNMMGSGGMMNGGTMGNMQDMNKMMAFMDSLHSSTNSMMGPDYYKTDSLMHNQMKMCKMMTSETDGIEKVYVNMQGLRKTHKLMF